MRRAERERKRRARENKQTEMKNGGVRSNARHETSNESVERKTTRSLKERAAMNNSRRRQNAPYAPAKMSAKCVAPQCSETSCKTSGAATRQRSIPRRNRVEQTHASAFCAIRKIEKRDMSDATDAVERKRCVRARYVHALRTFIER